jgi:hypothetical protein
MRGWPLLAALLLAASAARAELPPPLATAVKLCLTDGPSRADRVAAAETAGLGLLAADARGPANILLAASDLFTSRFFGVMGWRDDPAINRDRLTDAIDRLNLRAERFTAFEDVFLWQGSEGAAALMISYATEGSAICALALPPGDWAADLSALTARPAEVRTDEPQVRLTHLPGATSEETVFLVDYRLIAFGGLPVPPLVAFPPTVVSE